MEIIRKITDIPHEIKIGLTIGNFDGVHCGHQSLIASIQADCKSKNYKLLVITFVPHPVEILHGKTRFLINSYEERRRLLEEAGVDYLYEVNFNRDVSTLGPRQFLDNYLDIQKNIRKFYVGYDFSFGANKTGDHFFILEYCKSKNIETYLVDEYLNESEKVSSSEIRKLLSSHQIEKANKLLSRSFFMSGRIKKGAGRGRQIGFPTANLDFSENLMIPAGGVYITRTIIDSQPYFSLTNVGNNPTFVEDELVNVETHILDFDRDIYGEVVRIEFLSYLRIEKKFSSVNELSRQIEKDILSTREYFQ